MSDRKLVLNVVLQKVLQVNSLLGDATAIVLRHSELLPAVAQSRNDFSNLKVGRLNSLEDVG